MWQSTLPRRFGIILEKILDRHERSGIAVRWNGGGGGLGNYNLRFVDKTPIPLDGDSATIQNFGQNDTNRNRNGKRAEEAPRS